MEIISRDIYEYFGQGKFPAHESHGSYYKAEDNFSGGRNTEFWPGMLWLACRVSLRMMYIKIYHKYNEVPQAPH